MRKIALVLLFLMLFVFSTTLTYGQENLIKHSMYSNAYSFFEGQDNWYVLNLEYRRIDAGRIYFGGYVSKADSEEKIGKCISGSIPENRVMIINMEIPLNEIVY